MALRGERIGTAFIKIIADGTGMDESIEKALANSDEIAGQHGEKAAKAYEDSFVNEAAKNDKIERSLDEKFAKLRGKIDALGAVAGEDLQKEITDGFTNAFRDSGIAERDARALGERSGRLWAEGFSRTGNLDFDPFRIFTQSLRDFEKEVGTVARTTDGFFFNFRRGLSGADEETKNFAKGFGKAFGKGSRNDAVNLFGSVIGGAAQGLESIVKFSAKAGSKLFGLFSNAEKEAGQAEAATQSFSEKLAGFGEKAGAFAAESGPAIIAIFAGIVFVAGPAAGLISGLAAAIVALGGAVAFALGAGFGVFVGLMPVLAIGLGGLVLAINGLKKIKGLGDTIKPITDEFKRLQGILAHGLLGGVNDKNVGAIVDVMKQLEPLARGVGEAFGNLVSQFAKISKSPGFKDFVATLTKFVPHAIEQLGHIIANVFGGFAGIFNASLKITKDFLKWINRGAKAFSDWANSAKGQSALKDFFERGARAAKAIWDVIKPLGKAIGDLFSAGLPSGVGILDNLAGKFRDFVAFIQQSKKDGSLAQWFSDGQEIIGKVGDALMGVVDVFNALDTPENRQLVSAMLDLIAEGLKATAKWFKILEAVIKPFFPVFIAGFKSSAFILRKVGDLFGFIHDNFTKLVPAIKNGVSNIGGWFHDLWGHIKDGAANAWQWIKDQFANIKNGASTITHAVTGFFSDSWSNIKQGFTTVKDWVVDRGQDILDFFKGLPDKIAGLAGDFLQAGKDLGGSILDGLKDGLSAIGGVAADFAGAIKDAINSALGLPITIHGPGPLPDFTIPAFAGGGVFDTPTFGMFAERGPEAIVPLNAPLATVDPAVRNLSAIAQGKTFVSVGGGGRTIDVGGITIVTPSTDPVAVATETINKMTAQAYF